MTYYKVPPEIHDEVVRQQDKMHWPEMVPHYVEFKRDGKELWTDYTKTTISDCEQIGEYHIREGNRQILRWMDNQRVGTMRRAARHILMARVMRCRYIVLMKIDNTTEADMPFPCMTSDELRKHLKEQRDA